MILQTGFRTDIPAFYSAWFANRLRAGFVLVRNPYDPQSVTRYAINPDVVDLIGFCTKNPAPMLPRMELLRPYGQYWFVTITPYGPEIEPGLRDKQAIVETFQVLGRRRRRSCRTLSPCQKLSVPIVSHGGMTPFFFPTPTQLRGISRNSSRWHLYFPAIPGPV